MCRGLLGLVLLVLLVSLMEVEASVCETRSQLFRGVCFRSDNCASICEKEGFLTGKCKGFLLRCICEKDCGVGDSGTGAGGGGGSAGGPPDGPPDGGDGGDGGAPGDPSGDPIEFQ